MISLLAVSVLISTVHLFDSTHSQVVHNGTCEKFDLIIKPAYVDWPFRVDCNNLRNIWESKSEKTAKDILKCELTYKGYVIDKGIQVLTSVDDDTLYIAKLIINRSICISNDIRIDLQIIPETCSQSVNQSITEGHVIFRQATLEDKVELRCIPPKGMPDIIPSGSDKSKFSTRWYVNCKDAEYRTYNKLWSDPEDENPGFPKMLVMPHVDFWDAAQFTCTVEYEGKILYVVTYAQCIKQQAKQNKPTLTCIKEKTEAPGHDTKLDCTGQIVLGTTFSEDLLITWKKNGEKVCVNQFFNRTSPGINDRQSCIAKANNDSIACVTDGASTPDDEIQEARKSVEINLFIRNLEMADYGEYEIELQFRDRITGEWKKDMLSMTLLEDRTQFYRRLIIAFSATIAVIIPVIVLCIIYRYFIKVYILLLYKKSSLRKYDKDDKEYVAYLSYLYNTDNVQVENLEATMKVVLVIHKLLDELKYNYYDEQHQSDFSVQVEQLTNMVEKCHRMIIVLSPEYFKDKWRRFHAELGYHGFTKSKMGLLFILLPNVERKLKKSSRNDKVWEDLRKAMKVNPVIRWKTNMNDETLKDSINCYLPKLHREKLQLNLNGNDVQPEYLRALSQTTTCTEVA